MKLIDHMYRWGDVFFRKRIHLPFLLILFFLLYFLNLHGSLAKKADDMGWELFALVISLAGFGIRIWVTGSTKPNTSGRNTKRQKADECNTKGVYSLVRHPLYLANIITVAGFALFFRDPVILLLTVAVTYGYYEKIIIVEEKFLSEKFENIFESWARTTPVLWPKGKGFVPSDVPFDVKRVLRREFPGLLVIGMTFFGLNFIEDTIAHGRPRLDPFWSWLVISIFVIWIVLRTLKKYTTILKSTGKSQ